MNSSAVGTGAMALRPPVPDMMEGEIKKKVGGCKVVGTGMLAFSSRSKVQESVARVGGNVKIGLGHVILSG